MTGANRATKHDFVRSLGASDVIDTETVDITRIGHQWDVIIDTAGRRPLRRIRKALTPDGTLVLVGGEGGDRWMGGFDRHFRAMALSRFVRQDLKMLAAAERGEDLVALNELIEAGKLTPIIDRVYPACRGRRCDAPPRVWPRGRKARPGHRLIAGRGGLR